MNIGDLIVNLSMNSLSFHKGIATAQASLNNFASSTVSAIAPVTAALASMWGASASVTGYKSLLASQNKLAAAVNATGGAAGLTAEEMVKLGESLQNVTNFEDETTNAAMAMLASFKNIKGDQFKATIKAAMDMSTIMGGDLSSNAVLLGKALNDPEAGLTKLAKAGVTFTASQEEAIKAMQKAGDISGAQTAILSQLESTFGGAAEAMADPWQQLQFALGDVADSIGAVLLPNVNMLVEGLRGLLSSVGDGVEWFKSFGIESATVLSNMGGILAVTATQWQLFFVQLGLDAEHFFIKQLPVWAEWAFNNSGKLLIDFGNLNLTVFENIGTNIKSMWKSIIDYFSGNPVKFDWTPLTEGFKSTIQDMPDIPKRMTSDLEKSLRSDIDAMTDHLADQMQQTRDKLTKQMSMQSKAVAAPGEYEDLTAKKSKSSSAATATNEALLKGSSQAFSAIFGASRRDTEERTAKATELATQELKKLNNQIGKLVNRDPVVVAGGEI